MKPKYIENTVGVPIRMTKKMRDKWKLACIKESIETKEKVSYSKWIEKRL